MLMGLKLQMLMGMMDEVGGEGGGSGRRRRGRRGRGRIRGGGLGRRGIRWSCAGSLRVGELVILGRSESTISFRRRR